MQWGSSCCVSSRGAGSRLVPLKALHRPKRHVMHVWPAEVDTHGEVGRRSWKEDRERTVHHDDVKLVRFPHCHWPPQCDVIAMSANPPCSGQTLWGQIVGPPRFTSCGPSGKRQGDAGLASCSQLATFHSRAGKPCRY